MGILNRVRSLFRHRERVSFLGGLPSIETKKNDTFVRPRRVQRDQAVATINSREVKSTGITPFHDGSSTSDWLYPQYDHFEIECVFDTEGYFSRATRAKQNLFNKEGYEFVSPNERRSEYIKARIFQMELATKNSFRILLKETARDLAVHCNAYWLKVRNKDASNGKIRTVNGRKIIPVAGYFRLPVETMIPKIDRHGNIVAWKQLLGRTEKIYNVNDIVHFKRSTKSGYPLGVPDVIATLDDIQALRVIEENIGVLIEKHLFPIILWRVGTEKNPAKTYGDGQTEVDYFREEIMDLPAEGSIAVSERHDVKAIGLENKALRVESYLEHFKERLFAGFDASAIDMGSGTASSRSTAQTLSRNLVDAVKDIQITIQEQIMPTICELLAESTFPAATLFTKENIVRLHFKEIDKEAQIKIVNHLVDVWNKNGITFDEMRIDSGREVLTPEEEQGLYWNKFGREEALIGSVDENSGKGKAVENNNNPQNQGGSRGAPKLNQDFTDAVVSANKDPEQNPILYWHDLFAARVQKLWAENNKLNIPLIKAEATTNYDLAAKDFTSILGRQVRNKVPPEVASLTMVTMTRLVNRLTSKLRDDLIVKLDDEDVRSGKVSPTAVFSSLEYRTHSIYNTEIQRTHNYATFLLGKRTGAEIILDIKEDACEVCQARLTSFSQGDNLTENDIGPYHPNCTCGLILK